MHQCLSEKLGSSCIHTEYLDVVHCKINKCGVTKDLLHVMVELI